MVWDISVHVSPCSPPATPLPRAGEDAMQESTSNDLLWLIWVAVKELKLNSHSPETILFAIYPYYGN